MKRADEVVIRGVARLLKIREVASVLGISTRSVYRLIQRRELPQVVHVGRSSRLPSEDVATYLERVKRERDR